MIHPDQSPDDIYNKPMRFRHTDADGSMVKMWEVRSEWEPEGTLRVGEMTVRESEFTLAIAIECCIGLDE